jgi:hypothetical protein
MKGRAVKRFIICSLILFSFSFSFAQKESYIPLNIRQAYEKGTRSYDGKPGPNYWQNHSKYIIKANLDPRVKILKGSEDITYYNESPDSLSQIVVRLYQNISKPTAKRDFYLDEKAVTNGVILKSVAVRKEDINLNNNPQARVVGTNLFLKLPQKLAPKSTIDLSFSWELRIPDVETIRFGSYDSTSIFVAYWYPQISVYDDIDGWDRMDYSGTLEMYNDFSDFDVQLEVPASFQIWSTGVWQNPEEILTDKYLNRYKQAWNSDDVIRIFGKNDLTEDDMYKTKEGYHTFKYKAEHVPDFAFGVSDHYLWDAVSFKPDKNSDRRVYCTAAYKESSKDFVNVAYYAMESLKYYSYEIPGVPFPYPSATVFNGSGGMEFPMIVNNGSASTKAGTVHLTSHELAHQYLPFYMGTNERKYPFMDEGWAVMLPYDFQERMAEGYKPRVNMAKAYENFAGNEYELPLMVPSPTIGYRSYRTAAYTRPALAYDFLRQTLGDKLFLKAMQTYMARWNGKHPIPTDFFFTFNEVVGKDLGWYWKPWFYEFDYPDLAIKNVKQKKNYIIVTVINKGKLPLPIKLQVMNNSDVAKEIVKTPEVWSTGKDKIEIRINGVKNFDAVILGSDSIPDVNKVDNVYIK